MTAASMNKHAVRPLTEQNEDRRRSVMNGIVLEASEVMRRVVNDLEFLQLLSDICDNVTSIGVVVATALVSIALRSG